MDDVAVPAPANLTQHLLPVTSIAVEVYSNLQKPISVTTAFALVKDTRGATLVEADDDMITHCLTVVIDARLKQDPVPEVEILQSLSVKVENEMIVAAVVLDIRHSVIKTVPPVALMAVDVFEILHPKIV
jgi:hypothetical protein